MASLLGAEPGLGIGLIVGAEGELATEAERLGVRVRVLPLPERVARTGDHALGGLVAIARHAPALLAASAELAAYGVALRREMRAFAPRLVHSNGLKTHLLSALLPMPGVPLVWHVRDFVGERAVMAHVLRAVSSRPAALLAISRSVAEDIARALGRKDATVVYNGIDTSRFTAEGARADLDRLAGMKQAPEGVLRVGIVATYARWKGQSLFLEAAARVVRAGGAARFYVVGGPTYATVDSQLSRGELEAQNRCARPRRRRGARPVSGGAGAGVPGARHRRARQHSPRAVRADDRRGDGLLEACRRGEGGGGFGARRR